jgi:hypothetical protein
MAAVICILILQGASAVDMHFSASSGGESVSIWDHYDVDNSVEVSGQSSAGFSGGLSIDDSRRISGPGDVYVVQGYSGSDGYFGMNYIYAEDATHTLALGSAHLTPEALGAVQDVSISGAAESAVVSTGSLGGRGAMQHASVMDGSLDSRQTIDIDGAIVTSQDTQIAGFLPTAFGTAGYMDFNQGPGTLKIRGEGAGVAVSSIDILDGISEIDCNLAAGTGNSAWAYGDIRSATSDAGAVGAGAGAGKVNLDADFSGGIQGLYIDGYGEAAGVGIGALGVENKISGTLTARTGDGGTSASGTDIEASNNEASNKRGGVAAAAAAGNLGIGVDLQNGFIEGGAEAAGVGVGAVGRKNEITAGTLAAGTGSFGTESLGRKIEASNEEGFVVAAAAAGGLDGGFDFNSVEGTVEAEGAIFGAGATGKGNYIGVGRVRATTGNSADVVARDVEARSTEGAAGTGAAAGNVKIDLTGGTIARVTAEGSAVGAGAIGESAYAGADRLKAESGDSTEAVGRGLTASVEDGIGAGIGAIGATYDSDRPGSGWEVASVSGDLIGGGEISGNFHADTGQSATATANNVFAFGDDVYLGSHADDGRSSSDVDTFFSGVFADGRLRAYAGDSTMALQKGRVTGRFKSDVEAYSTDPLDHSFKDKKGNGVFDINMKAWTDDTGAYTRAKKEVV